MSALGTDRNGNLVLPAANAESKIWKMARSDGGVSNSKEHPNLAKSFASTKAFSASDYGDVDNLDAVFEALSAWEEQLRDVDFDISEPKP